MFAGSNSFISQVVLAASICTRGGKAVLARAFHDIKRSRIEALLAAFPKAADSGTQHTTVEQDNVRFVYQPLDELYMVLITNKQSNILQDIDSLHLFSQVVSSICKSLDEREILKHAFDILSAFDELVTLGYRENLSVGQIKTFLEMESHEERIQEIIARVCRVLAACTCARDLLCNRTRNWRRPRSERGKPSSWRCNARSRRERALVRPVHRNILHTLLQPDQLLPKRMIRTRQRRTRLSGFTRREHYCGD